MELFTETPLEKLIINKQKSQKFDYKNFKCLQLKFNTSQPRLLSFIETEKREDTNGFKNKSRSWDENDNTHVGIFLAFTLTLA